MMKEIKKIDPLSLAKIEGFIMVVFGFILGLLGGVGMIAFSGYGNGMMGNYPYQAFGLGMIVFYPILYGVMGFLSGYIGAWIYNLAAKKIGGVKLDL